MFKKFITKIAEIAMEKHLEMEAIRKKLVSSEKSVESYRKAIGKLTSENMNLKNSLSKYVNKQNVKIMARGECE